ncbi:trigger factor [Levilactobacillus namurensis DSM 19117]|uniref:Trigger factor n=2 Tax=Levilactobacillus namurensis TaxID=380393 RepID=A0A0R1KAY3_9LACO|nr:trigger factor [Levilactobacillus namurensis]PTM24352.1 trigger factor [Lactobacillus sp. PFC-70]KRK77425.1 trigger factor [Levilactobacillus namurensis DSM 19117]MCW3778079.1 trigger factor [Levilactobacillus namurensis]MDT7014716.1 trigger factor [Levilactobacillus namurensis]MDT7018426.1 trigger factor [Levilactobacillus namurensis]
MAAKWEKKDATKGELTFEIAPDKIKEGLDKAFQRTKKNLAVPGFRKGRVPRQIFDQMYGEEALYQDALNIVLPDAYEQAIKDTEIEPVDQPQVDVESMDKGKAWVLKAVVTVKPDVKLGEYKNLSVTKQNTRVYQKDIDAELEKQRQQQAELVLKEDEAAAKGDTVVIDFDGYVDGKQFDGGKADNYSLELGSNSFIPGFEDQLVGHKAGENVDVKVTFPKDYQAEDLRDKEATFKVTIHEVKEKQLPELDDEFAKDVDEDVDSLDELKAKTKDRLKEQKTTAAHDAIEDEAISEAVDNAEIAEVPEAMIKDDIDRQMDQYLANMQQQGIQPKMYFQLTGTTEDDLRKQFADGAEKRVKTNLVLEAVVEAEKIEPTEDQIKAEVKDLAGQYGMEESAVRSALSDDMLKHDIAIKAAVDLIADSAKQDKKKDAED